ERRDRQHERHDVVQHARRIARLPRKKPVQRGEDREPGQEQDQGEVHFDQRVHAPAPLLAAFSASAAASASSAACTAAGSTPSPGLAGASASAVSPRLRAAIAWPAARGASNAWLCSSTRSPSTSLK